MPNHIDNVCDVWSMNVIGLYLYFDLQICICSIYIHPNMSFSSFMAIIYIGMLKNSILQKLYDSPLKIIFIN